jgi:hypothetical protein
MLTVNFFEAYEERKRRRQQREIERKARKELLRQKVLFLTFFHTSHRKRIKVRKY